MIRNPIRKVLSTMRSERVRCLLMGGQACVLYGAAEFSRDTDYVVLADPVNLRRLFLALRRLQAECIAVPPPELSHLLRGHALHFRCRHPAADGLRIDIMACLRGVAAFPVLWKRRTTLRLENRLTVDVLALPDLVQAKKTQRDKDWPMIRRLLEVHYLQNRNRPNSERVAFWLKELRTPALLVEAAQQFPRAARALVRERPLLKTAIIGHARHLDQQLLREEMRERRRDRRYWEPLRRELEQFRRGGKRAKVMVERALPTSSRTPRAIPGLHPGQ